MSYNNVLHGMALVLLSEIYFTLDFRDTRARETTDQTLKWKITRVTHLSMKMILITSVFLFFSFFSFFFFFFLSPFYT